MEIFLDPETIREKIMDSDCPERLEPDPVNIRPGPKPCSSDYFSVCPLQRCDKKDEMKIISG